MSKATDNYEIVPFDDIRLFKGKHADVDSMMLRVKGSDEDWVVIRLPDGRVTLGVQGEKEGD